MTGSRVALLAVSITACAGALAIAQPERGPIGGDRRAQAQVDRLMNLDQDGDGKLSKDEIPERLMERLADADADGDGFLTREELTEHMSQRAPGGRGEGAEREEGGRPDGMGGGSAHEMFEGSMKKAGGAMRELRRSPLDATSRDSDLAAVQSIQEAMVAAKDVASQEKMAPQAKAKYGDDTETYQRDLRLSFLTTIRAALDLEEAIAKGDIAAARKARDSLMEAQHNAHDQFQEED